MDNRTWIGFVSGLVAVSAAAGIAVSCMDQPPTKCQTGRGVFAAKYRAVSEGDGGCLLKGEPIGIQPYNPANADKTAPDIESSSVAIRSTQTGQALTNRAPDLAEGHQPYALGKFAKADPGADDFCDVPSFEPSIQELEGKPEGDAGPDGAPGTPAVPAVSLKYEWKNVRFYVTAAQAGVQMIGDLTYTKNGCQAEYKVTALYPSTSCASDNDSGPKVPDQEKCLPPDLDKGRRGSAINSDVDTVCDPDLLLCVLARDPPSNH
ncbi:MAG TPA: hypothetical protein VK540_26350 [Polyangiaceae bacterium]|nr:hypothetical protein [Polyangiaceae bacterium]